MTLKISKQNSTIIKLESSAWTVALNHTRSSWYYFIWQNTKSL